MAHNRSAQKHREVVKMSDLRRKGCWIDADGCVCPKCGKGPILVVEKEIYYDGEHDAYCPNCDIDLIVTSVTKVQFLDPVSFDED